MIPILVSNADLIEVDNVRIEVGKGTPKICGQTVCLFVVNFGRWLQNVEFGHGRFVDYCCRNGAVD